MGIQWHKYKTLDAWRRHNGRFKHTVVGSTVYWERKRDGHNMSLLFHKGFPMVYTHYQKAKTDVETEVKQLLKPYMEKLKEMLGERYILYFELVRKGKSPAQFEFNAKSHIKSFDIYDTIDDEYISPDKKYKIFRKYHIPHTYYYTKTKHENIEDFESMIDKMIDISYERDWEGFVAKWVYKDVLYAIKVKTEHKYPKVPRVEKPKKVDNRPTLERSEVRGAIDNVFYELSTEDFKNPKIAMPLIARGVSREEKKHGKKNRINLYAEYLSFIQDRNI